MKLLMQLLFLIFFTIIHKYLKSHYILVSYQCHVFTLVQWYLWKERTDGDFVSSTLASPLSQLSGYSHFSRMWTKAHHKAHISAARPSEHERYHMLSHPWHTGVCLCMIRCCSLSCLLIISSVCLNKALPVVTSFFYCDCHRNCHHCSD